MANTGFIHCCISISFPFLFFSFFTRECDVVCWLRPISNSRHPRSIYSGIRRLDGPEHQSLRIVKIEDVELRLESAESLGGICCRRHSLDWAFSRPSSYSEISSQRCKYVILEAVRTAIFLRSIEPTTAPRPSSDYVVLS